MTQLRANQTYDDLIEEKLHLDGNDLSKLRLSSSTFSKSSFTSVDFAFSATYQSEFRDCKFMGVQWNKAEVTDSVFIDCRVELASFMFTKLDNVRFERCTFIESDFRESSMKHIVFDDCQIESIDFSGSRLEKSLDISSSSFTNIKGLSGLKGLVVSERQLPLLSYFMAEELGIRVKDQV